MITLLALLAGCQDQGFSQLTQVDVFEQEHVNVVDVLLLVDNSCSMVEEQEKLASNFDSFIQFFESAEVAWQIGVVTTDVVDVDQSGNLIGGDDEIVLLDASGVEVDRVSYDRDWAIAPGVVFSLDSAWSSVIGNDSEGHWCTELAASPGALNDTCGGIGGGVDTRNGDLVVTEFLADPDGVADDQGEWLELTNFSSETTYDLTGYSLVDDGRNAFSIPDGTTIAPGGVLVFARTTDVQGADIALGADFTLNNNTLLLTPETEGAAEIFSELVAQGTGGSGIEQGLEAARLALYDVPEAGGNAGLLREEANLSILVVSDEEDSSPLPVPEYLNLFAALKGEQAWRDHVLMNVSGVVGEQPPEFDGEPSCQSSHGYADFGERYVYAAQATDGLLESICDEDFSPIVEKLGLTLSGLRADFVLSSVPVLDETFKVELYESKDADSKLQDLTIDVDFTYIEETNTLHFENEQVPPSQHVIVATYTKRSGA